MGVEENKEVVSRLIEAMENHVVSTIDELLTSDCVFHLMGHNPPAELDREQVKEMFSSTSPSDVKLTIEDMITEGDKISIRFTQSGEYAGISTAVARFSIYRIQDGKVTECWTLSNGLGQFQQLGILPSTDEILKNAQNNTN